jgi:hypothetical protein
MVFRTILQSKIFRKDRKENNNNIIVDISSSGIFPAITIVVILSASLLLYSPLSAYSIFSQVPTIDRE